MTLGNYYCTIMFSEEKAYLSTFAVKSNDVAGILEKPKLRLLTKLNHF